MGRVIIRTYTEWDHHDASKPGDCWRRLTQRREAEARLQALLDHQHRNLERLARDRAAEWVFSDWRLHDAAGFD